MYKFNVNDEIDFDAYERLLTQRSYIVYDYKRMYDILKFEECRTETLCALALDCMVYNSGGACYNLSSNCIIKYLMEYENCKEHYFRNKKTQGYSLDSSKVLDKLKANGYAEEFLDLYMRYKSSKARCDRIRKLLDRCFTDAGVNKDGVALKKIPFQTRLEKNYRFNYRDNDIIAIPKEYNSCISVDDGYFLAWGDFAQSDFRIAYNLFMRSPENDKLMNAYEDKYEALARMVANVNSTEFDYDKFKAERQLYKKLTLATVYGTRNSLIPEEQPFISAMTDFLYKCEKYSEYERRLKDHIALKLPLVIDSYFHNEQSISKYSENELLFDALNTPVQTGTSEIVVLTVTAILKEFYKLGYSEDDISVYYVRHDEPVFRISNKVKKDIWVLQQFNQIIVDDWTPLKMDFKFGYYYKLADEELTAELDSIIQRNDDKIEQIPIGNTINDFYPIQKVFEISTTKLLTPDNKVIYTFYNPVTHTVRYKLLETPLSDDRDYAINALSEIAAIVNKHNYSVLKVCSNYLQDDNAFYNSDDGGTYIGVLNCNDNSMSLATILGRYMYCRYCKKMGIDYDINLTPHESDADLISSVKDFDDVWGDQNV